MHSHICMAISFSYVRLPQNGIGNYSGLYITSRRKEPGSFIAAQSNQSNLNLIGSDWALWPRLSFLAPSSSFRAATARELVSTVVKNQGGGLTDFGPT